MGKGKSRVEGSVTLPLRKKKSDGFGGQVSQWFGNFSHPRMSSLVSSGPALPSFLLKVVCYLVLWVYIQLSFSLMEHLTQSRTKFGIGIAAEDNNGKLITTWSIPVSNERDAEILEAEAIRKAFIKAMEEQWTSILIHSDCKQLVEKINIGASGTSPIHVIMYDIVILSKFFWRCTFTF